MNFYILLFGIFLVIFIIVLIVYFVNKSQHSHIIPPPPPPPSGSSASLTYPEQFYSMGSLSNGYGIDMYGDTYYEGKLISPGYKTVNDLKKFPLTYAYGNSYYTKSPTSLDINNYDDWDSFCSESKNFVDVNTAIQNLSSSSDKVLLVEKGRYYINTSVNLKGIVVRNSGVLVVGGKDNSDDIIFNVEFIFVESGGLFQAGSSYIDKYRFNPDRKFVITLKSDPLGYSNMGVITSQYHYKIYAPGVVRSDDKDGDGTVKFAPYTGDQKAFSNTFGAKIVAVGFNGNLHLAGAISNYIEYTGTWNSTDDQGNYWTGQNELTTYFQQDEKQYSKICNVETEYPNMWTKLDSSCVKGQNYIVVDSSCTGNMQEWKEWSQIVITCKTDAYNSQQNKKGQVPIYVDNTRGGLYSLDPNVMVNENKNISDNTSSYVSVEKSGGVEVCTIDHVDGNKIYLKKPLQFNHNSEKSTLTRTNSNGEKESIIVDTRVHVGLLSRNIILTSSLENGGDGCNVWYWDKSSDMLGKHNSSFDPNQKVVEKEAITIRGSGGSVVCNYTDDKTVGEITDVCYSYLSKPNDNSKLSNVNIKCGPNTKPEEIKNGHWIFGSQHLSGCGAIHGGQTLFRSGSCVNLDAVELKYMGTPANFGTIAQYSIHWHLSGYAKSFTEYLLDPQYTRESRMCNSSIWCSFNRWVTIHGTHEADCKNNIGFICYGSGYFIEDGSEVNNTWEHNMGICCLPCKYDTYANPIPIYANVSSDICFGSTFWFKNNRNRFLRNVACNSPSPILGVWAVPQIISKLRGPPTVAPGDFDLKIPGTASVSNVIGGPVTDSYMSQSKNNLADFNTIKSRNTPLCYSPDILYKKGLVDKFGCVNMADDNSFVPYLCWAENIFYNIMGGICEFPDTEFLTPNYGGVSNPNGDAQPPSGKLGCILNSTFDNYPQFIPMNGQNSCTDAINIAQSLYFGTGWGGSPIVSYNCDNNCSSTSYGCTSTSNLVEGFDDSCVVDSSIYYGYQPISSQELKRLNNQEYTAAYPNGLRSELVPKIFCNNLSFNLGPLQGELIFGAGWIKIAPYFLINNCFLSEGGGTMSGDAVFDKRTSSVFSGAIGGAPDADLYPNDPNYQFPPNNAAYFVMYNHMTDGGICMTSAPQLFAGEKTFLSDDSVIFLAEEVTKDNIVQKISVLDIYCDIIFTDIFPQSLWSKPKIGGEIGGDPATNQPKEITFTIYNFSDNSIYTQSNLDQPINTNTKLDIVQTRKYPYMCGSDFNMFTDEISSYSQNNPEWRNIVINAMTGIFLNNYSKTLGDELCQLLSKISVEKINECLKDSSGNNVCFFGKKCLNGKCTY